MMKSKKLFFILVMSAAPSLAYGAAYSNHEDQGSHDKEMATVKMTLEKLLGTGKSDLEAMLLKNPDIRLILDVGEREKLELSRHHLPGSLKHLKITGAVTHIGHTCLYGCSGLTSLDLSALNKVTHIGWHFLDGCSGLTSLDLSGLSNVTQIGFNFLGSCSGLTSLDLSPLSKVTHIEDTFLDGCSGLTSLDLSALKNVTHIKFGFLVGCSGLTSLNLSVLNNLTEIWPYFLAGCSGLTKLDLSPLNKVTHIGEFFLAGCSGLTEMNLLESLNLPNQAILRAVSKHILTRGLPEDHNLVQTAISRLTVLDQDSNDPTNPFKVWGDLLVKRNTPTNWESLISRPFVVADSMVTFHPDVLASLSKSLQIDPTSIPHITHEELLAVFTGIEAKLPNPNIEDQIRDLSVPHNNGEALNFAQLKERASLPYISNILSQEDHPVGAKLRCLIRFALNQPEGNSLSSLSLSEEAMIGLFSNIKNCDVGQSGDISELYTHLPAAFKLRVISGEIASSQELEKAHTLLKSWIQEIIEQTFDHNDALMKRMCGTNEIIEQHAHQALYLKNLLGEDLGLSLKPRFDINANMLYVKLLDYSKEEALRIFYDAILIDNAFLKALEAKINTAVMTTDAYLVLEILKKEGDWIHDGEGMRITPKGVLRLLLSLGVLKESYQLFQG
jgi:hypothetical protein